jgi:hypothetical protein
MTIPFLRVFINAILFYQAGVKTKVDVYPGVPHGFQTVWSGTAKGKQWLEDGKAGIDWLLSSVH